MEVEFKGGEEMLKVDFTSQVAAPVNGNLVSHQTMENGLLPDLQFCSSAVVFSEGWPSLALVLESLKFSVRTYRVESSRAEASILDQILMTKSKSVDEFAGNCALISPTTSYWIQGSEEFVQTVSLLIPKNHLSVTGFINSSERKLKAPLLDSFKLKTGNLSHSQVGGITLGHWPYFAPESIDRNNLEKVLNVQRSLKHILNHVEIGRPHLDKEPILTHKRKRTVDKLYTGNSRVIPGTPKIPVTTHSVKQSCPRIKRYLSNGEVLDLYDVQTMHQDLIKGLPKVDIALILDSISKAVPEKLIYQLVIEVQKRCLTIATRSDFITKTEKSILEEVGSVKWLSYKEEVKLNDEKAARNDDAMIETDQWDWYLLRSYDPNYQLHMISSYQPVEQEWKLKRNVKPQFCTTDRPSSSQMHLLAILRRLSVRKFKCNVRTTFISYMKEKYTQDNYYRCLHLPGLLKGKPLRNKLRFLLKYNHLADEFVKDLKAGHNAISRAAHSTFWDWDAGSSLFFWRWPKEFIEEARDGTKVYVKGELPKYTVKQQWPKDERIRKQMEDKWMKVINRQYINYGYAVSLTGSFPVPKGESDIRMVYDATKCGLNDKIWAPNFMLPTIDMTTRHVDQTGWFGDLDVGEQFLNFALDTKIQPYAGIDATELRKQLQEIDHMPRELLEAKGRIYLRWERCLMGLHCSPYHAARAMGWADDFIRGDRHDPFNIFRWDRFVLNLPGMKHYEPSKPKGYKWDDKNQTLAANFETYVDDIRSSYSTEAGCVLASRKIASRYNYLGIQDAGRKRRFPSQNPGVWCGAKTSTDHRGVYTSTTQAKWDKGKKIVSDWLDELRTSGDNSLLRKPMLSGRGFLVHLSRTYPGLVPFLKGVHHTLESWRRGRDADGWKFNRDEWRNFLGVIGEVKEEFKSLMTKFTSHADQDIPERVT